MLVQKIAWSKSAVEYGNNKVSAVKKRRYFAIKKVNEIKENILNSLGYINKQKYLFLANIIKTIK